MDKQIQIPLFCSKEEWIKAFNENIVIQKRNDEELLQANFKQEDNFTGFIENDVITLNYIYCNARYPDNTIVRAAGKILEDDEAVLFNGTVGLVKFPFKYYCLPIILFIAAALLMGIQGGIGGILECTIVAVFFFGGLKVYAAFNERSLQSKVTDKILELSCEGGIIPFD